jgi:hypothetical protein
MALDESGDLVSHSALESRDGQAIKVGGSHEAFEGKINKIQRTVSSRSET